MIARELTGTIQKLAKKYPVVSVTGPRQSGKTTLVKSIFPNHKYLTFENPETRNIALSDPKSIFTPVKQKLILDEIQHVPELLSYIQVISDEQKIPGQFILAGSQSLLLSEKISQTLAGRTAILKLLPFSISEVKELKTTRRFSYEDFLFNGFYPRIYDQHLPPSEFYPFYLETYVQRDVRNVQNVRDLNLFTNFLRHCAGRTGQLTDYSSLSKDTGVSVNTIRGWISILEAGYIIMQVFPFHKNFGKRLIKSPKLYFTDPGLACYLLGIKSAEQLSSHYLKGALFESLVILEILKKRLNAAMPQDMWFFRDSNRNEIDLVLEHENIQWIEMKSSRTFSPDFANSFKFIDKTMEKKEDERIIVYGGDDSFRFRDIQVISWKDMERLFYTSTY